MRILLDAHDLINLIEHANPFGIEEFDAYLRTGWHQNVLSFTNVRELAGPLARGNEFLRLRPMLQSLERLPHTYIKEVAIAGTELQSAVDAFNAGAEYQGCTVFADRWDRTLLTAPTQQGSGTDNWVNFRLDEIVYWIQRTRPDVFAPPDRHLPTLQRILEQDRERLRTGQAPARQHFINALLRHAQTHGVSLPDGREREFAEWVYANPNRCPGLRLHHEAYRALMSNHGDVPVASDFSDLAHIWAVPYVDAATFDRRMRHYCGLASREVQRLGETANFGERLYADLGALTE